MAVATFPMKAGAEYETMQRQAIKLFKKHPDLNQVNFRGPPSGLRETYMYHREQLEEQGLL